MPVNHKIESFEDGAIIKDKTDQSDWIYLIRQGKVKLFREEQEYATLVEGEIFGEIDFILEKPTAYKAVASGEVEIEKVDPRIFNELNDTENSEILKKLLQAIAEKLRYYENKLIELQSKKQKRDVSKGEVIVILKPETVKAKKLLNNLEEMEITKFPFRVGRFSKRGSDKLFHKNDLYLLDTPPYSVSRSHFEIIRKNGDYLFRDRGSKLGTIVNSTRVGGNKDNPNKIILDKTENSIKLGNKTDNIKFTLILE